MSSPFKNMHIPKPHHVVNTTNTTSSHIPVNVNTNAEFKTGTVATASSNSHSASAIFDNSTTASANMTIGNSNASLDLGVSAKTGTVASASGGLDGKNVYANASYSDTTEIHATATSQINYKGVGTSTSVDAYAQSGNQVEAHISAGANGLAVGGSASSGTFVGVNASNTTAIKEASVTTGAGVSFGEHFEAGGSGEATFKNGKATIGVSGDVAVFVGLEADVSVTVDTKQIQKDAKVVANAVTHEVTKDVIKVVNDPTVKQATHEITNTAKKADEGLKKGGNEISKGFKKIHF